MDGEKKTKEQLKSELTLLHRRVAELENNSADRRVVEETLEKSEKRFRVIFDNLRDGLLLADEKTRRFLMGNAAIHRMLGYTAEELTRIGLADIHPEQNLPWVIDRFDALARKESEIARDIPIKRKDGGVFYADISASFPMVFDGKDCLVGVFRDITERKQAEEALEQSEQHFRTLVENAPDAIFVQTQGDFAYLNPAAICLFNATSAEQLLGTPVTDRFHPDCRAAAREQFRLLNEEKKPFPALEQKYLRLDGTAVDVAVSAVPFCFQNRAGALVFVRNITERKEAEKTRLKLEAQLAHAQKMEGVGRLAGGIAHDFNNLLGVILGSINLIQMSLKSAPDFEEALKRAEKACLHASDLTRLFLTLSKGGAPVKRTQSLRELLEGVVKLALSGSSIKPRVSIADDLWLTHCDSRQIHQAVMNLLINAKEAMESGGAVDIIARNVELSEGEIPSIKMGKYAKVSIEDHGRGIPKENLPLIFDPYFSTKSRGARKGMGLGLTLAYSILRKHDGHILMESESGVGSRFHVYLPAAETKVIEPAAFQPREPARKGRVLVMDDEEILREVVRDMLRVLGYEVETGKDGFEAIERFRAAKESGQPFDIVILDLTVRGGMGAKGAISKLLELDPSVKAIVSSGYSDDRVLSGFREYGFVGALRKPYQMSELSEVIQTAMVSNE